MKKLAIVSGASRGIGKAIAYRLADSGYDLVITACKDMSGLERVKKELSEKCNVYAFKTDQGSSLEVNALFDNLKDQGLFDSIELLVNNAGMDAFELVQDTTDKLWHRIMDVNANGVFYMCRAALPSMLKKHSGNIINISSYWGLKGAAMESAYCASKGAVNAFTLSLASEVELSNIRVNAICCEYVDTDMNEGFTDEEIEEVLKIMPSHRIISPEEIAELVNRIADSDCQTTGKLFGMEELS